MRTTQSLLSVAGALVAAAALAGDQPAAKPSPEPTRPADAMAIVDGAPISAAQFNDAAAARLAALRAQEYEIKRQVLDDLIGQRLLEKEARARGISVDDLLKQEVEAKVTPPTDADVHQVYENAKARAQGRSEAEVSGQIRQGLTRQRTQARRAELLRELRAKASVSVFLEPPRVAVEAAEGPAKGPKDAPITIVEFSDFQCPYCSRVMPTLKQIEDRYGERVRLVFRDFPLPIHPLAPKAAEAAACAEEQGRFWEMHDKLFANQGGLQVADLKQRALELGLDADQFNQCLDSGKHEGNWKKDVAEGTRYGVSGTPAFFVNGRLVSGARPLEDFTRVIDEELERAGLPIPPPPAPKAAPQPPTPQ